MADTRLSFWPFIGGQIIEKESESGKIRPVVHQPHRRRERDGWLWLWWLNSKSFNSLKIICGSTIKCLYIWTNWFFLLFRNCPFQSQHCQMCYLQRQMASKEGNTISSKENFLWINKQFLDTNKQPLKTNKRSSETNQQVQLNKRKKMENQTLESSVDIDLFVRNDGEIIIIIITVMS